MQTIGVKRGDTLRATFSFLEGTATANLASCQARMQLRTTGAGDVALEASSVTGGLVIDGPAGAITLDIPAAAMAAVPLGRYLADIKITYASGAVRHSDTFVVSVVKEITDGAF